MYRKNIIIGFIFFIIIGSALLYNFTKKELLPLEDRGAYLVIGFTDEGSSFDYTQQRAEDVERRLIPLLKDDNSPYKKFLMMVGVSIIFVFILYSLWLYW